MGRWLVDVAKTGELTREFYPQWLSWWNNMDKMELQPPLTEGIK